jgi:hypothetical protein
MMIQLKEVVKATKRDGGSNEEGFKRQLKDAREAFARWKN